MPKFSIVIPSSVNSSGLRKCLESVVKYSNDDVEIVVTANGANEETRAICHEFPVLLTWLDEPCGYAAATNLGIKRATGKYLVLLNDDCQVLESPKNQWLETLCAPFDDPTVALTGIHEIYSYEIRHNFPPFYCVMIRREMFDVIGLLDESLVSFGEDVNWIAQMLRKGYRYVNVDAGAVQGKDLMVGTFPLYHVGSVTVHQDREAYEERVQWNLKVLRDRYKKLRLLVAIPNYGIDNIVYLQQVVNELCTLTKYEVDIVIHSSVPMVFGHEQVTVKYHEDPPNGDWVNLAWECRKTIYDNRDAYDLYLYNENDQLITERNVDAFVKASETLPEDKIAGFIRYENHEGQRFYPDFHRKYVWESEVNQIGEYTFARFTNLHQGSFLVTRKQLDRAIDAAGENAFCNIRGRAWSSPYDNLARVSTDLYDTGFEKVIAVSHFEDFLIHHLPDKYYGVYDTKCDDVVMPIINSMVKRPKYSIVVPTFLHLSDCLIPCCETLKKYTDLSNVECLIVANGCGDDGTREYVESLGEPFRLIWFDEAQGFTRATNAGIREAKGKYILFINNDVYFTNQTVNGWLNKLQELWDSVPNAGVVGPLVEDVLGGWKFVAFYMAMTSQEVIDKVGMLDEVTFNSAGEDIDFCVRAAMVGYGIIGNQTVYEEQGNKRFAIDFPIHHLAHQTVLENPNFMENWQRSNAILMERYDLNKPQMFSSRYEYVDAKI